MNTPRSSIVADLSFPAGEELRIRQIEIDTKVPQRFRFPMFDRYVIFPYSFVRSIH